MKTIPSCPMYNVDEKGNIFSTISGIFMKPRKRSNGYLQVLLRKDGKYKTTLVHRAVMEAFHGPSDKEVNHKNGNKTDNRLCNLEYVTTEENMQHASLNNLLGKGPIELYKGAVGMWFPSQKSASCFTKLRQQETSSLVTGSRNIAQGWRNNPF